MKINKWHKSAFTLAEVLVTLAIIGIVAAISVPSLVSSVKTTEYKAAYKKKYADLQNATLRVFVENGSTMKGITNYIDKYKEQLNYYKECDASETYGNCWANLNEFYHYNGTPVSGWGGEASLILNDGSLLFWGNRSNTCQSSDYGLNNVCAKLFIDFNSLRPPNTIGKDIHTFYIFENGTIKPQGIPEDSLTATCDASDGGFGCGYLWITGEK